MVFKLRLITSRVVYRGEVVSYPRLVNGGPLELIYIHFKLTNVERKQLLIFDIVKVQFFKF